jgi:oligopeptide/dipeptide ABC transporter ATP-binding protein
MTSPSDASSPTTPLLAVRNLAKRFESRHRSFVGSEPGVMAVDDISFDIQSRETLGLVGESGCGKSTAARLIMRLIEPTRGEVYLEGKSVTDARRTQLRAMRRDMQMIFQDPYSSLNARMRARDIVAEPLRNFALASGRALDERIADLFEQVGLRPDQMDRYPREFSGGQRQRIGIARALALSPKLIVCDEPVSALDVSVQAQVVNLLRDLQEKMGLSYLFVAHDIAVVEHLSQRIAVMYLGKIVEIGATRDVLMRPIHPYTQALLSAVPKSHPSRQSQRVALKGDIPSPRSPPPGCRFSTRCPIAEPRCKESHPPLREVSEGHFAACHLRAPGGAQPTNETLIAAPSLAGLAGNRSSSHDIVAG